MRRVPLVTLAVMVLTAAPAAASFPGANGPLVVSVDNECTAALGGDLVAYDPRTGTATPLTDGCSQPPVDDSWEIFTLPDAAPDGASVLAVDDPPDQPPTYARVPMDGGAPTRLTLPAGLTGELSAPSFNPAATGFAAEGDSFRNGQDEVPLFELKLDGAAAREIRPAPIEACDTPRKCSRFEDPRWSPNGKWLLAQVETPGYKPHLAGVYKPGLWIISARTGKPIRRISEHGHDGDWSPDSKLLVYSSTVHRAGKPHSALKVVRVNNEGKRTLVVRSGFAETQPRWSPDGSQVAWIGLAFGPGDESFDVDGTLWRVAAKGGKPKRITKLPHIYVEEGDLHEPELTWAPRKS